MEYYEAVKTDEILGHTTMWKDIKIIKFNKRRKTQKLHFLKQDCIYMVHLE